MECSQSTADVNPPLFGSRLIIIYEHEYSFIHNHQASKLHHSLIQNFKTVHLNQQSIRKSTFTTTSPQTPTMPIRVALIGLSPSSWASTAHLPYLTSTTSYKIVAVCNTSITSAQTAIKDHDLPSGTKAYGSVQDLAADASTYDLVVCTVRVDRHYDAIKPVLEKGKDVYVEWPMASNLRQAEELSALAREKGVRTMVGLQGRRGPPTQTVKEIVASGRIGKVLSSTLVADAFNGGPVEEEKARIMLDRKTGGNVLTVHFGHCKSASECFESAGR